MNPSYDGTEWILLITTTLSLCWGWWGMMQLLGPRVELLSPIKKFIAEFSLVTGYSLFVISSYLLISYGWEKYYQ